MYKSHKKDNKLLKIKNCCNSIIMEYQKITHLLNDGSSKPSKFKTKKMDRNK